MHRLPRAFTLRQQQPAIPRLSRNAQRRTVSQVIHRPNGETMRYQAVRFKKPGLTPRRLITISIYCGAAYAYVQMLSRYLDIQVELLDEVEGEKEVAQAEEEEAGEGPFYADEDSFFIPCTWATKMPRTFYRGSDEEWQDFIKVAKDKARQKKINEELVQTVYKGSLKHPIVRRQLGKDTKVGKYWLDISFPDGPPQEYERSGIEFGDGFIAWSQQKIDPDTQWRTMRALWPKAAFESLYATGKVVGGLQYRRLKQALGWEGKDPFSPEERYKQSLEMMQKQQHARESKRIGKPQTDPEGSPSAVVSKSTSTSETPSTKSTTGGDSRVWQIPVPMPPGASDSGNVADLPIAMHAFSTTLAKHWNPKKAEPPRGSFIVQGLVEVRGTNGRMMFDVQSCYDPKQGKFVAVAAGLRNFKKWNQVPRGGP